ncbi:RING finger and CHY zinc finger domain-containing protein 1 [Morus notabilis]|uniref:RING finger and CHY zinc finger domain-containing protein 1 n=1 Tax=Morus notabilis TaxID=981085 RepID=W9R9S1_9ROSA|nr:RING finger and CHY zinc finger domain-containing protein 1 [Morus notabilis]
MVKGLSFGLFGKFISLTEIGAELQMEVGIDPAQYNWIWFRDFFKGINCVEESQSVMRCLPGLIGVRIIAGGAASELLVVMRFSIVAIAITRQSNTIDIDVQNNINVDQKHRHDIPRHQIRQVICSLCGTEQEVQQVCFNCGVCMGKYFCETCKLFDDDISKRQYHCNGCGICRIGGRENFFHCYKCGCCYSILLKNSHPCVEGAMHHDCPVCFEFLFESRSDITVMPCGHTIHTNCLKEMREHYQYACPLCAKSVCDMSRVWEKYDMEIAATPMPEPYQNKLVWILCNDCGKTSEVPFHLVAQKCLNCKSYNTRQIRG